MGVSKGQLGMRGDEARFAGKVLKRLESLGSRYQVESKTNLLYSLQIDAGGQVRPAGEEQRNPKRGPGRFYAFQTDILVRKVKPGIPLVVVELKFGNFNTHDIITYSAKAARHKQIYPYLRYGFVLGGRKSLTNKFFVHNQSFDFAMWVSSSAADSTKLTQMIKRQIRNAEKLLGVMRNDRPAFRRYESNIAVG